MNESTGTIERFAADWRLKLGAALFLFSIIIPLVGVPVVVKLDLSTAMISSISGGLLMAAEMIGLAAVAVMGKSGYIYIKKRVLGFLKRYKPPDEVSRRRYIIGLLMFWVPILFGWLSIYTLKWIPGFITYHFAYAIGGDLLLLASLFVLGGNFWDKIRALFSYSARTQFKVQP